MSFLSRLLNPTSAGTSMSAADFVADGDPKAPVLDVRTPAEFASGHLAGAVNVDFMSPGFQREIAALKLPADEPVYLYCRSGNRSGQAVGVLRQMGHAGAVNIGGIGALTSAGAKTA